MSTEVSLIDYISGLDRKSAAQRRLLELHDMQSRSGSAEELYLSLHRAETARRIAGETSTVARRLLVNAESKTRRIRTRRLIELGGLTVVAGVAERTDALLVGALHAIQGADQATLMAWSKAGGGILAARAEQLAREKQARDDARAERAAELARAKAERKAKREAD